ncbi:N-acetylglutamate synthase [Trichodelitschia bisporula]|uniref:Amino-acid acetyltransferase, mitochondrial n=1 Tax=Trichodelitschia bisporula TaxID=703511 RepID=A0A6G1I560_9PEZI|nr:N-acetylglutamate synthase [Trichodelitschia bisporula]
MMHSVVRSPARGCRTVPNLKSFKRLRCPLCTSSRQGKDVDTKKTPQNGVREMLSRRDFFLSVLSTTATKRDAQTYLKRFKQDKGKKPAPIKQPEVARDHDWRLYKSGVNLGGLYGTIKSIEDSPVFTHQPLPDLLVPRTTEPLHVAIVKIREPQSLNDETLSGVGLTLAQLARLGLLSVVVVDDDPPTPPPSTPPLTPEWRDSVMTQSARIANAIQQHRHVQASIVSQALTITPISNAIPSNIKVNTGVDAHLHKLFLSPLSHGRVLVIPPLAYSPTSQVQRVSADDVVLALTRLFAGLNPIDADLPPTSLDRIIVLDPLGGIPAPRRPDGAHIFINLEQEYGETREDMQNTGNDRALQNLDLIRHALALVPPTCSALLTTPAEAASSALVAPQVPETGVRTRPKRNPLLHNLLTDRPVISSSLPVGRLAPAGSSTPATFFKRGMPLTVIPDPRTEPWLPPGPGGSPLRLESDPRIDFARLRHLIEDSFGRPLDAAHYLSRIQGRVAGIIVAGEYEGGAILTWEDPGQGRPAVPYLDKFAVLRRAQGSGGVADVVFNAMVRTCLPGGVVWRSRVDNPVNKWYFERAGGTWRIPGGKWTMFWTGDEIEGEVERWADYVAVCGGIEPSWLDTGKKG